MNIHLRDRAGWYIENCRTTIGEDDPVVDFNRTLYDSKNQEKIDQAKTQKIKKYYFANILVVKDPAKPENDGKVFIFKFGKKILDKILEMQNPTYEGDEAIDPFDLWEGVNFRLSVAEVMGYPNYDKSKFDTKQTAIADSDENIEAIWKQRHDLSKLIAPENIKSYDELSMRLKKVLGASSNESRFSFDDEVGNNKEKSNSQQEKSSKFDFSDLEDNTKSVQKELKSIEEDDDEDLAFFKSLNKD